MTVHFYSSSDASAPALRGNTPGDLINLLTKCLVDGYGSKTGAGWSKPFTGTNVAVFKTGAGSNGFHLRVDDTATDSSNRAARITCYEAMTDVSTGTGQFPTDGQQSGGMKWFTHYTGTAADARPWFLVADEGFMVLLIQTYPELQSAVTYFRECYWFGDLVPTGAADTYATVVCGQPYNASPNTSDDYPLTSGSISSADTGHYIARSYTGLGGSLAISKFHDYVKSGTSSWGGSGALPFPHGPDGALLLSQVWVSEPGSTAMAAIRGTLPGIWAPLQSVLNTGDTFDGQGDLAGRRFMGWRHYSNRVAVEISDTWR